MPASNDNSVQQLSKRLIKEAKRLTGHDPNYANDLVQEVWCKVLTRDDLGKDKMNKRYLTKVLRNHYYDRKKYGKPTGESSENMEVPCENDPKTVMTGKRAKKLINSKTIKVY